MKIRKPAVAGQFYPKDKIELMNLIRLICEKEKPHVDISLSAKNIIGGIVPHAGYIYSAYQAVHFFEIAKNSKDKFDTVFIINPNHNSLHPEIALDENDCWETPLGKAEIDKDFYSELGFEKSEMTHKYEHSGEVILPLLQYFFDYDFKIVPVTISTQSVDNAVKVANAVYSANKKIGKHILIIASSDFSHFLSPHEGKQRDDMVIKEILNFNTREVYKTIVRNNLSVCGFGPIMALMEYSKLACDKPEAKILKRGHSGEIIPSDSVVDYVSMLFCE